MMNQLLHSNGVTDTQAVDSSGMARPRSLTTNGAAASWASGIYSYDDAGNIKAIGSDAFVYDPLSRITSGTLASASNAKQTYTYDDYGNLTKIITNGAPRNLSVNAKTNRLTAAAYDSAGNMLSTGSGATLQQHQYDAFNMMTTVQSTTQARGYVYTADDERMVEFDFAESPWVETWTIRSLDKKVLRQWTNEGGEWLWSKDYIYRGSLLLASEEPKQAQHLHLDHLGTPRLITSAVGGGEVGRHTYFPFGEEVTDAAQDGERMKFTGHERDLGGAGGGDDLDYMHARYYKPNISRFLSVDVILGDSKKPQTWNRYIYGRNNPIFFVDLDGREERRGWAAGTVVNESSAFVFIAGDDSTGQTIVFPLNPGENSVDLMVDADAVVFGLAPTSSGGRERVIKLGPGDIVVSDSKRMGQADVQKISGDLLFTAASLINRAGPVGEEFAIENGWVLPESVKDALAEKKRAQERIRKARRRDSDPETADQEQEILPP